LVVAGSDDGTYRPQQRHVHAACEAADMHVAYEELPGGHGWQVWRPGLEKNLDWLARQTMLAP
jgi:enterochelin esterase-like enzyme